MLPCTLAIIVGCQSKPTIPVFDEQTAYRFLEKQCDFGPRNPNSAAHQACENFLFSKLSETTDICRRQSFKYFDSARNDTLFLTNIIASYYPKNKQRLLLCAHWDCRPWADEDPDSSNHTLPIMGANDGASGVAVLLTIADILQKHEPAFGIDIAFFDGEDYGTSGDTGNWLLGSKYFAKNLSGYRPIGVILLDMIGDADLQIHKEHYSATYGSWLVDRVWTAAALENAASFLPDVKEMIYDDHIPFLQAGIPAIDIIDKDYPYWHTLADTPDKCSPHSLGQVGRAVIRAIYDRDLKLEGN